MSKSANLWPVLLLAQGLLAGCSQPSESQPSLVGNDQSAPPGFCAAFLVVTQKCVRCHADPPLHGAPFALDSYEAITAPSPSSDDPARTRADRMLDAVESGYMPYMGVKLDPPVEALSCEEKRTLLMWLSAGAAPPADGDTSCTGSAPQLLSCDADP